MTKIAIIDMGTNTFHLLLAEVDPKGYRILLRDHQAVRIGMAGINEGFINSEACCRAIDAMSTFKKIIDQNGITDIHAYGTSAFRNARNGRDLAKDIENHTGIHIRIVSGDEEADFIFAGIREGIDLTDEVSLVMDIGAGSVECIIGNANTLFWKQSFEIGGQRLLEKFQKHDPILPEEIRALDLCFDETLKPLFDALSKHQPVTLVGSSGSFDTLSDIFSFRREIPRTSDEVETPLTMDGFYEIYLELITKNREARLKMPGMISLRVDMIVVACCLIRYVIEKHSFANIRVSTYSLKEGVLAGLAEEVRRLYGTG